MTDRRRRMGADGEARAREALERAGYRTLARNYRCRHGEVDLVAEEGGVIAFVEVKTRLSASYGAPVLAVTRMKRRRIARAALHFLSVNRLHDRDVRFDVVSIVRADVPGADWRVEILRGAFTADDA